MSRKIMIDLMPDNSEIVHYDTPGMPLYVRTGVLSSYIGKKAQCHWHDDIELIYILDGKMNYYVNGIIIELNKDEGIMVNSKEMHYGYSFNYEECIFICILFHPSLLSSSKKIFQQFVVPLLEGSAFPCIHLVSPEHKQILEHIQRIWRLKESNSTYYEIDTIGILFQIWSSISQIRDDSKKGNEVGIPLTPDVLALRHMVSYIHSHYKETISLQSIADSANICKSKCCKVFKSQMGQYPIDFLNHYRLNVSGDLMKNTPMSISDIALECGFNNLSYFSKIFLRYYGSTPSKYRHLD
jgi:AraC-like DNA-binding protein